LANGREGDPVKATLEGKGIAEKGAFGIVKEFVGQDGQKYAWKAVYQHMPPSSYQDKAGKEIKPGEQIGTVSNYATHAVHLHYENWFGHWREDPQDPKNSKYIFAQVDPTLGALGDISYRGGNK
jgi:murein DD-endopeptidase MepM/ murein hydrolase activator NlpD